MASDPPGGTLLDNNADILAVPIHIVNHASQLPAEFLDGQHLHVIRKTYKNTRRSLL